MKDWLIAVFGIGRSLVTLIKEDKYKDLARKILVSVEEDAADGKLSVREIVENAMSVAEDLGVDLDSVGIDL